MSSTPGFPFGGQGAPAGVPTQQNQNPFGGQAGDVPVLPNLFGRAVTTGEFKPLDPGPYKVQVTETEFKQHTNGKWRYWIQYTVVEGDSAGKRFRDAIWLTEDAAWRLQSFLYAAAMPEYNMDLSSISPHELASRMLGKRLGVFLVISVYNEQANNNISRFLENPEFKAQAQAAGWNVPGSNGQPAVQQPAAQLLQPAVQQPSTQFPGLAPSQIQPATQQPAPQPGADEAPSLLI